MHVASGREHTKRMRRERRASRAKSIASMVMSAERAPSELLCSGEPVVMLTPLSRAGQRTKGRARESDYVRELREQSAR